MASKPTTHTKAAPPKVPPGAFQIKNGASDASHLIKNGASDASHLKTVLKAPILAPPQGLTKRPSTAPADGRPSDPEIQKRTSTRTAELKPLPPVRNLRKAIFKHAVSGDKSGQTRYGWSPVCTYTFSNSLSACAHALLQW